MEGGGCRLPAVVSIEGGQRGICIYCFDVERTFDANGIAQALQHPLERRLSALLNHEVGQGAATTRYDFMIFWRERVIVLPKPKDEAVLDWIVDGDPKGGQR